MLCVVQRVASASVTVIHPPYRADIGPGLCALVAVLEGDTPADAQWLAAKLANLRIFRDSAGKMNRSVTDIAGEILLVSQFTLAGDCSSGNRPSFITAAAPQLGNQLYVSLAHLLRTVHNLPVKTGVFGAMMSLSIVNDGPVTLILASPRRP